VSSTPRLPLVEGHAFAYTATLAHQPATTDKMETFYGHLWHHGVADTRLKELMRIRNARKTNCLACQSVRFGPAQRAGFDESQADLVDDGYLDSDLPVRAKTALRWADHLLGYGGRPPADLAQAMQEQFTAEEIVEMSLSLAYNIGFSKFQIVLGTEPAELAETPRVVPLRDPVPV
jgi:alkylhydroperoxidase family enzyme